MGAGERRYVFVGGSPRSGTSALARLLCCSPRVAIGLERFNPLWRARTITEEHFRPVPFLGGGQPPLKWPAEEHIRSFGLDRRLEGAEVVGDKFPGILDCADHVFATFPRATVVAILRNPFSVCESHQARADNPHDSFNIDHRTALRRWNAMLRRVEAGLGKGQEIVVVTYERLFRGLEPVRRLFARLGLPFDDVDRERVGEYLAQAEALATRQVARNETIRFEVAMGANFGLYRHLTTNRCILSDAAGAREPASQAG